MRKRRQFTEEFKREAVKLTELPGATVSDVAKDLDLTPNLLSRWRSHLKAQGDQAFPGHGNARDLELAELRRELNRVKKERDFLKEATAFFAKQSS